MALLVSGAVYEHREIVLRDKPGAMLTASPKGTVPVLVLADGSVIEESIDIMRWALSRNDPETWLARDDVALVGAFDGAFKYHLDRYKYAERHGADAMVHRAAGLAMLEEIGARLAVQPYLGGAARGFSDIALFPFVRQFAGVDRAGFAANASQRARDWLARLVESDLFARAMVKVPLWSADAAH